MFIAFFRRFFAKPTPTHCKCGARGDVFDPGKPWIVRCARCHLRKSGLL